MAWNISEAIYQISASEIGDRPALIHGDQNVSYKELVRRASGFSTSRIYIHYTCSYWSLYAQLKRLYGNVYRGGFGRHGSCQCQLSLS